MNYLAHAFLSEQKPLSIIGNIMGDFVKGRPSDSYDGEILKWIVIHRKIDSFTDSHRIFRLSKRLISTARRRYSGVIVDIAFDHFLAKNWLRYSTEDLSGFIDRVYLTLRQHESVLPERLKNVLPRLVGEDWLGSYKTLGGIDITLNRISRRIKRDNMLHNSVGEIKSNYEALENNFMKFFPKLINYVDELKMSS